MPRPVPHEVSAFVIIRADDKRDPAVHRDRGNAALALAMNRLGLTQVGESTERVEADEFGGYRLILCAEARPA